MHLPAGDDGGPRGLLREDVSGLKKVIGVGIRNGLVSQIQRALNYYICTYAMGVSDKNDFTKNDLRCMALYCIDKDKNAMAYMASMVEIDYGQHLDKCGPLFYVYREVFLSPPKAHRPTTCSTATYVDLFHHCLSFSPQKSTHCSNRGCLNKKMFWIDL